MKKKRCILYGELLAILAGIFFFVPIDFVQTTAYDAQKKLMANKVFMDMENNEYRSFESGHAVIYYAEAEEEFVPMVTGMVDSYYQSLSNDLAWKDSKKIPVILHGTKKEMAEAVKAEENNVPMGAYYSGVIHILSPSEWIAQEENMIDRFMEEGPVIHEMVHYMLDHKLLGQYDIWFTEGVALYFERKYTNCGWRDDLAGKCDYITYADLKNKFHQLDEIRAYRRSYEIIDAMINDLGEGGFQKLLGEMKKGGKIEKLYPIV